MDNVIVPTPGENWVLAGQWKRSNNISLGYQAYVFNAF